MNKIVRNDHLGPAKAVKAPRPPARQRGNASPPMVLAIVCVGICLANLDLFIVNVALPNIGRDFKDASLEDLSWVLNGYAIVFAALLVPAGRLADQHAPAWVFLTGMKLDLSSTGLRNPDGSWK